MRICVNVGDRLTLILIILYSEKDRLPSRYFIIVWISQCNACPKNVNAMKYVSRYECDWILEGACILPSIYKIILQ